MKPRSSKGLGRPSATLWTASRRRSSFGTGTAFAAGLVQFLTGILAASTLHGGAMYLADAAMILTFVTLGKWLECKAKRRAARAIRRLLDLRPAVANVLGGDAVETVPVGAVRAGRDHPDPAGRKGPAGCQSGCVYVFSFRHLVPVDLSRRAPPA